MTDRERAIVMAYTEISMLGGEKFKIFHDYVEEKLGRPVQIHELASDSMWEEIKKAAKNDFLELCKGGQKSEPSVIKVEGTRGSGKTSQLLKLAKEKGYTIIVPTENMVEATREVARNIDCLEVPIISMNTFMDDKVMRSASRNRQLYLVDELNYTLKECGVVGYSNSVGDDQS